MSRYWFKPKRYGFGAAPSTWEGWALVAAYLAALVALSVSYGVSDAAEPPLSYLVIGGVITFLFIVICWRTTEGGWHWRWGDDR